MNKLEPDKQEDKSSEPQKPKKSGGIDFQMFAEVSQIAFIMAAGVIVGYFVGDFLDNKLGTAPWLTIIMLMLGLAAGLKSAYDTMNKGGRKR